MWTTKNSHPVRCDPFERFCKQNRVAVSPNQRNRFVVICVWKAMNNVMPVFWAPKITMRAAIKIASCDVIREPFAATRIRPVVRIANSWRRESSVAKHNTLRVNRRHDARADNRNARNHRQWSMGRRARNVANAATGNAFLIARRKACRVACATSYKTRANVAVAWASMKRAFRSNPPTSCPTARRAFKASVIRYVNIDENKSKTNVRVTAAVMICYLQLHRLPNCRLR